jgi:5-formyltetrahydrofolate cyclo-ligase
VLVPALAVDRGGHRLGRGGGHYDRTLALLSRLRAERLPPRIALVYDEELLDAVPVDQLDQLVTAVITPSSGVSIIG